MDPQILFQHDLLQTYWTKDEAEALQIKWREIQVKNEQSAPEYPIHGIEHLRYVVGVDIAYETPHDLTWGYACAVLWDLRTRTEIEHVIKHGKIDFPYISGLLAFREANLTIRAILALSQMPQVLLCDGHGYYHSRRFGEASHLGLLLETPSIGIAKEPFQSLGQDPWRQLERTKGNSQALYDTQTFYNNQAPNNTKTFYDTQAKDLLGYAICLSTSCKPAFVSTGYMMTMDLALKIALECSSIHRQPEPLYLAHTYANSAKMRVYRK